jgi:hypothetical protein
MRVPEILQEAEKLFRERDEKYGSAYKKNGEILNWMVGKLNRYCANFGEGGHADSAIDLVNYSAMLRELTSEN